MKEGIQYENPICYSNFITRSNSFNRLSKIVQFCGNNELTQNIPKPIGLVWLFSTLLFLLVIAAYLLNKDWWVIPATIAVIISQILLISVWEDAKYGTLPNIIISIAIIIGFSIWNFNHQVDLEIKEMNSGEHSTGVKQIITEQMITPLPPQVQKWLRNIGMVGKENINSVYFKQKGTMKLKPNQTKWSNAFAEQYVITNKPAFIWKVRMDLFPSVKVVGRDYFINGKGKMLMKIASLIPVANATNNNKINQSTLQRYLLELPWYPSAALRPYISWEGIDEYSAKATMNYNGTKGSAIFHFNSNGDLLKISALRYKESDKNAEPVECIGEVRKNSVIDGIKIPTKLDVSWMLDKGLFTWYRLEIYDVAFH